MRTRPARPTARSLLLLAAAAGLLAACTSDEPPVKVVEKQPGVVADPNWLTFRCVKPGCDTTLPVTFRVEGERRVAIKRIVLSDPKRTDFALQFEQVLPFVVTDPFTVNVRFVPTGSAAPDINLLVTYTDASPDESPNRLPPGEVAVPLMQRLVGEPALGVEPQVLEFGAVPSGESKTLPLKVTNAGFGNTGLRIAAVETDADDMRIATLPTTALLPGESVEIPVTFAPSSERFSRAKLVVKTVETGIEPAEAAAVGTSLAAPAIAVSPGKLDFGEVARGEARKASVEVTNQGGVELAIDSFTVTDPTGNLAVSLPNGATSARLAPLGKTSFEVALRSTTAGALGAAIALATNDPRNATFSIPIDGVVTEPRATATPASVDFGLVPKGWSAMRPVSVENTGWGDLQVLGVNLVGGSSDLFTLRSVPTLPAALHRGQRLGFEVGFRADAQAPFAATVSIETNDPTARFLEVPIKATGSTCGEGCPLPHATPTCANATCEVDSCEPGFFNTDAKPANGCECAEIGTDPGPLCSNAVYLGKAVDKDHTRFDFRGVLPTAEDVDVLRFFGEDAFGGTYRVRVVLQSADPSLELCVYYHGTENHLNECYWENKACPANRTFERGDSWGDESADYTVKISRKAGVAPTCTPYTLQVSND